MTLNLIGAGFGRTGTSSLRDALNDTGYRCYHMTELSYNQDRRGDAEFWEAAAKDAGASADWAGFFADYRAVLDFPACAFWRPLMAAFPDAKVVLTVHPKGSEAWYDSTLETIHSWHQRVASQGKGADDSKDPEFDKVVDRMMTRIVWGEQGIFGDTFLDRASAIAAYEGHNQAVRDEVPAGRLVEWSADQGWPPICAALGIDIPDRPFPRRNDRSEMSRRIALLERMKGFKEKRGEQAG